MIRENVLTTKGMDGKGKIKDIDEPQHKKKKKDISPNKKDDKESSNPLNKIVNFSPLNMPTEKVLLQIKDDPNLRRPKPLSSLPYR